MYVLSALLGGLSALLSSKVLRRAISWRHTSNVAPMWIRVCTSHIAAKHKAGLGEVTPGPLLTWVLASHHSTAFCSLAVRPCRKEVN